MTGPAGLSAPTLTLIALTVAAAALLHFAAGVHQRLGTGMTGFDSTWYHGPFAAGFFQSGDTWGLHRLAPQFLAWFYPANSELLHAVGMGAFDRDLLSPLLNLAWLGGCLLAAWCIGRAGGAAPWSLALVAAALSVPVLADQAGEARNDLMGIFFLLAAVAIALAWSEHGSARRPGGIAFAPGPAAIVGLSAGLAAGTKLNFLLPATALVVGLALIAPVGRRLAALATAGLAALAGGGYWYLRNLAHAGNPFPWFDHLGPISLPAPDQPLGGREQHSVLGYLGDRSVWSDWFLPGLHHGLTLAWPLLLGAALGGLVLCLARGGAVLRVGAAAGLAALIAWLVAPTSASGPEGMPQGFESGLRYLAPALALGIALLPNALALLPLERWARRLPSPKPRSPSPKLRFVRQGATNRSFGPVVAGVLFLVAAAVGYPVQRSYLRDRYADPTFTTPGLDAAFKWARGIGGARIGTTTTRQYPLFGTDLSNTVRFIGEDRPHGGFVAPADCRSWRRTLDRGGYDYVVVSRDRIEAGKPPYPAAAAWTEGAQAHVVLHKPPTIVFKLTGWLDPSACGAGGP
jgi:hypothetical protein